MKRIVRVPLLSLQLALSYMFLYKTAIYLNIIDIAQCQLWNPSCSTIGPYGVPWWIFYHYTTLFGYGVFQIIAILLDTIILGLVWKLTGFTNGLLFTFSNIFVLIWIPGNLLVFWISGFGKRFWPMSILALCTYLPVGAPLNVWTFILHTSLGQLLPLNLVFNILRYSVVGAWMISGIVWKLTSSQLGPVVEGTVSP